MNLFSRLLPFVAPLLVCTLGGCAADVSDEPEELDEADPQALTGCPAAAAKGGASLWANLEACGWPGARNTGPKTTALRTQGKVIIERNNTILENALVNGCIVVRAQNVTIRNVRVNFVPDDSTCSSSAGMAAINVAEGSTATITDTEVDGNGQVHIGIRNAGQGLTATRVNVHDTEDGIFANLPAANRAAHPTAGSNTIVTDSYFHSFVPRSFNNKTMNDAKRPNGHIDGFQTEGGATNTRLIHNTFDMGFGRYTAVYTNGSTTAPAGQTNGYIDSATALWNGVSRNLRDIVVRNNLFAARGGFIHYVYDRTGRVNGTCTDIADSDPGECGSVTNVKVLNNRYSTVYNECVGGYGVWFSRGEPTGGWGANGNQRTGNKVIETGESVDADGTPRRKNGSRCG